MAAGDASEANKGKGKAYETSAEEDDVGNIKIVLVRYGLELGLPCHTDVVSSRLAFDSLHGQLDHTTCNSCSSECESWPARRTSS